ncbi:MAG TPA: protein phosphatase 2C domain-containing protein [Synergistales bacterium]|nr:protein phosphatase 2C domain-containing protein [Synergistales bacterium]HQQ10398.1 protein phosphatase 2C domain-containing protein [Synergistales bacterium]
MIIILSVSCESFQDIGKRHEQQDAFGFSDKGPGILTIVCDGMGGMPLGRESSVLAVRSFIEAWEGRAPGESVKETLVRSAFSANEAVLEMAARSGLRGSTGTTLVAAVVEKDCLSWISVGDSRVYLFREGSYKPLNRDHNVATRLQKLAEKGELNPEDVMSCAMPDALTSFIGIDALEEYDIPAEPMPLKGGDVILLCTDGLYNFMPDREVVEILKSNGSNPGSGNLAEMIVGRVMDKKHPCQDNVTVMLMRIKEGK